MNRQEKENWGHVDWVRDRVNGGHHQALTKYLIKRTSAQKDLADAFGLTVAEIMRQGFHVKNGHSTVPKCAITLVRKKVVGVDLSFVVSLCRESRIEEAHILELASALKKYFSPEELSEEAKAILNEAVVREVLDT